MLSDIKCLVNRNEVQALADLLAEAGQDSSDRASSLRQQILFEACTLGNTEVATMVLDAGASIVEPVVGTPFGDKMARPLVTACSYGYPGVVKMMLARGKDAESPEARALMDDALAFAVCHGHAPVMDILLDPKWTKSERSPVGMTFGLRAALNGSYLDLAKRLMDKGADLERYKVEMLKNACKQGKCRVFEFIVGNSRKVAVPGTSHMAARMGDQLGTGSVEGVPKSELRGLLTAAMDGGSADIIRVLTEACNLVLGEQNEERRRLETKKRRAERRTPPAEDEIVIIEDDEDEAEPNVGQESEEEKKMIEGGGQDVGLTDQDAKSSSGEGGPLLKRAKMSGGIEMLAKAADELEGMALS